MTIRRDAAVLGTLLVLVLLAGCSQPTAAAPAPSATPSVTTPAASPTPTATVAPVFMMPTVCTNVLSSARQSILANAKRPLIGGPGSALTRYYSDPTPEELAGGITCVWGDESQPSSLVTVSVAPLTLAKRTSVIKSLVDQGLNEAVVGDAVSYAQIGDTNSAPAILNMIRGNSWISVIEAGGGQTAFGEATDLAADVAAQVYRAG